MDVPDRLPPGARQQGDAPTVAMSRPPAAEGLTRPLRPRTIQPSTQPPAPRPPVPAAVPRRLPRPNGQVTEYVRRLAVPQVICWQVGVLTVLLTVNQPASVLVAAWTAAAVLLALTGVRVGGRWLYELAALGCGYLVRTRGRDLPETGSKTPALLDLLVPGAAVLSTDSGHGPAMTVSHDGGLAALLRPTGQADDLIGVLPPPAVLLPVADGPSHLFGVQAAYHAGVRRDGPPKAWLAVHAVRTVDAARDDELALALRNATRRVHRAVGRAGVPVEPLDEDIAFVAIAGLAHVTGGRNEVREDWRFWRTGAVSQATFAISGLDRLADSQLRRLVGTLFATAVGVAVTVTIGALTGRDDTTVTGVLRLAATTEAAVDTAASVVTARALQPDVRLTRLDGAHSSGVAASLPIGVFLP